MILPADGSNRSLTLGSVGSHTMLYVFGVVVLAAGIAAVALSLPDRAWNDAIVRLNARIRAERDEHGELPGADQELTDGGGLVPAARAAIANPTVRTTWLDGVLDLVIEGIRRGISSRGFPRTTLKVLGAVLIAVAVLLLVAATSFGGGGGGGHHEEDGRSRRTWRNDVVSVHRVERRASTGSRAAARADG